MAQIAQLVPSWDVGARAQLVSSFAPANPATPTFSSPSDRGTLDIAASSYSANVFTFKCRWDNTQNSLGARFLFAQVQGVNGLTPVFRVQRSNFGISMSSSAKFVFSYDGVIWEQFANRSSDATYYIFSHSSPFAGNTPYVALWSAWPTGNTVPWIQTLVGTGYVDDTTSSTGFVFETRTATVNEAGAAITSTPLHAFKVSSGSSAAPDGNPKRNMVLISGVHASEDAGNYSLKGAVEFLVSDDVQAQILRQWFDTYVYPVVSSAGRKGGGTRGDFQSGYMTSDVNRNWTNSNFETLVKHKAAILADTGGAAEVFIDFHATVLENYHYDYYETGNDNAAWAAAIRTYIPAHVVTVQDDAAVSTEWAMSALSPTFAIIAEHTNGLSNVLQTSVEAVGANHMRAVALLAGQEYFGPALDVTGYMAAFDTGLDTAVFLASGQFSSTGSMAATETGYDTMSAPSVVYASASTGHMNYTGRDITVMQVAFLGSSSEWNVIVDAETVTYVAT